MLRCHKRNRFYQAQIDGRIPVTLSSSSFLDPKFVAVLIGAKSYFSTSDAAMESLIKIKWSKMVASEAGNAVSRC